MSSASTLGFDCASLLVGIGPEFQFPGLYLGVGRGTGDKPVRFEVSGSPGGVHKIVTGYLASPLSLAVQAHPSDGALRSRVEVAELVIEGPTWRIFEGIRAALSDIERYLPDNEKSEADIGFRVLGMLQEIHRDHMLDVELSVSGCVSVIMGPLHLMATEKQSGALLDEEGSGAAAIAAAAPADPHHGACSHGGTSRKPIMTIRSRFHLAKLLVWTDETFTFVAEAVKMASLSRQNASETAPK